MSEDGPMDDRPEPDEDLESFMRWFRENYPGPDTIIHKPDWHSPKIYRSATFRLKADRDALLAVARAAEAVADKEWSSSLMDGPLATALSNALDALPAHLQKEVAE